MKLSVAIITYNEEENLPKTIESIKNIADEIIIVDSFSSDDTIKICKSYGAKVYEHKFDNFGAQKNRAIDKCNGEWILLIDADEVITDKLAKEIKEAIFSSKKSVYKVKRVSVCFGKLLHYGGWSSGMVVRLFKNGSVRCSEKLVHETYVTNDKIYNLSNYIEHYTYNSISNYLERFNSYTSRGAVELYSRGKKSNYIKIFLSPIYKFIRMYLIRLGFLDGYYGLVISLFSASYTMVKYIKLREIEKKK